MAQCKLGCRYWCLFVKQLDVRVRFGVRVGFGVRVRDRVRIRVSSLRCVAPFALDLVNYGEPINLKWLKTRILNLAGMLPGTVPTECLKNYFRKGAWPSSRDPVNCMALVANSYKIFEAIPYGLQICVSSNKARRPIGN